MPDTSSYWQGNLFTAKMKSNGPCSAHGIFHRPAEPLSHSVPDMHYLLEIEFLFLDYSGCPLDLVTGI